MALWALKVLGILLKLQGKIDGTEEKTQSFITLSCLFPKLLPFEKKMYNKFRPENNSRAVQGNAPETPWKDRWQW